MRRERWPSWIPIRARRSRRGRRGSRCRHGGDDGGAVRTALQGNFRPFVGTILDDEADVSITAGEGPFTGRFVPIEPLSMFDNLSVAGAWTLEIQDTATGDEGELTSWKLIINDPADTPPDYQNTSNIGDDSPDGDNDIDLYRLDVLTAGVITVGRDTDPDLGQCRARVQLRVAPSGDC